MDQQAPQIWFGPGGLKGVFGAGVALGLQQAWLRNEIDLTRVRLYGSSVGCLNVAFLATGNAEQGLPIFREETRELIVRSRLVTALGARVINRLTRAAKARRSAVVVPSVLDVDHVFRVIKRRTPRLVEQLRASPVAVFAESVYRSGAVRHKELRTARKPLQEIGNSLNLYPFTGSRSKRLLDSAIRGYGFDHLLHGASPTVLVLNEHVQPGIAEAAADAACAALCGDTRIARLYLRRGRVRSRLIELVQQRPQRVLLVTPPPSLSLAHANVERVHLAGLQAVQRIADFLALSAAAIRW
jgi:hypothetical protein